MQVEALWQELRNAPAHPAYRRVDEQHPLDLYAGIGLNDDALLMLVCDQNLGTLPSYSSLRVDTGRREDGRVAYSLSLQSPHLEPLFAQLCMDLIESSRNVVPAQAAAMAISTASLLPLPGKFLQASPISLSLMCAAYRNRE